MNVSEKRIYDGLGFLSEELAAFFSDGLKMENDESYQTKGYLLAHIMREVDHGLRKLLSNKSKSKELKNDVDNVISNELKESINSYVGLDYADGSLANRVKEAKSHFADVSIAFGFPLSHPITIEYIRIAILLHSYAHGRYKELRIQNDEIKLWKEYKSVLELLLGSHLRIKDRLDTVLNHENPSKQNIMGLRYLLKVHENYFYFFSKLNLSSWFNQMYDEGYFIHSSNLFYKERSSKEFYAHNYILIEYLNRIKFKTNTNKEGSIYDSIKDIVNSHLVDLNRIPKSQWNTFFSKYLYEIICKFRHEDVNDQHLTFIFDAIQLNEHNFIANQFTKLIELVMKINDPKVTLKVIGFVFKSRETSYGSLKEDNSCHSHYVFNELASSITINFMRFANSEFIEYLMVKSQSMWKKYQFTFDSEDLLQDKENYAYDDGSFRHKILEILYLSSATKEKEEIIPIAKKMYESECTPWKMVGIHLISNKFEDLRQVLFGRKQLLFGNYKIDYNLFRCIQSNSTILSKNEIEKYIQWVNTFNVPYNKEYFADKPIELAEYRELQKLRWLVAIDKCLVVNKKATDYRDLRIKYQSVNLLPPGEVDWEPISKRGSYSDITSSDIDGLKFIEIQDKWLDSINNSPEENYSSKSHFIQTLKEHISNNIIFYSQKNLPKFNIDIVILLGWIGGIQAAWESRNTSFKATKILNRCLIICSDEKFLKRCRNKNYDHITFVKELLSFIGYGLDNDKNAFSKKEMNSVKKLLIHLSAFEFGDEDRKLKISLIAFNSTLPITYMKLYSFVLRKARVKGSKGWDAEIFNIINSKINSRSVRRDLIAFVIGQYYRQTLYLEESSAFLILKKLFSSRSDRIWNAVVIGYLRNRQTPNRDLHGFLISKGHLYKALRSTGIDRNYRDTIVDQILIGYIVYGSVGKKNEISMILESEDDKIWARMEYFLWDPKNVLPEEISPIIKDIIVRTYNYVDVNKLRNTDSLKRGILKWIGNLNQIDDEVYEIAKAISIEADYKHGNAIIGQLVKHVEKDYLKVGAIVHQLVKSNIHLYGDDKNLEALLIYLYENMETEIANGIIEDYSGSNGLRFRTLYRERNLPN